MALDAFLKAVAAALVLVEDEEADMQDQEKTTNLHHIIFQHFIKDFTHLLVQDSSSSDILDPLEIAYAIRGVGSKFIADDTFYLNFLFILSTYLP